MVNCLSCLTQLIDAAIKDTYVVFTYVNAKVKNLFLKEYLTDTIYDTLAQEFQSKQSQQDIVTLKATAVKIS